MTKNKQKIPIFSNDSFNNPQVIKEITMEMEIYFEEMIMKM